MKYTAFVCSLLLYACSYQQQGSEVCRVVAMTDLTEQELDENINKLFAYKKTIVLSDSCKVYPASIDKVLCRNSRLYVDCFASRQNYLQVFDLEGSFLFQVGVPGRARNEYIRMSGFDVDSNGDIYINDIMGNKMLHYNANGRYIETIDLVYTEIDTFVKLPQDNEYLICLAPWNTTDPKIEFLRCNFTDKSDSVFAHYGKYIDENYIVSAPIFTEARNDVFFLNNLSDTVYRTNDRGVLVEKIYFDFGSRQVPAQDKVDLERKIEVERIYDKYTALAGFCCEDQKYIYGGLFEGAGKRKCFVLDESKKTIYTVNGNGFPAMGNVLGFDDKCLITKLDYASYKNNEQAFDEPLAMALQSDKIVICLYSN